MTVSEVPQQRGGGSDATGLRQGDVIDFGALALTAGHRECCWLETPDGVVVISQTCDLVRPNPRFVIVAPLRRLSDDKAAVARDGRQPSLVPLPAIDRNSFADLEQVASIQKEFVLAAPRRRGVQTDEEVSKFARLVGRKFSRFAFPDEVVYWFRPLEVVAQAKYDKPASPEGQLFAKVEELRVEPDGYWAEPPYALTLAVILEENVLPSFPNDKLPDIPQKLEMWVRPGGILKAADVIASRLVDASDPVEIYHLWNALAEAWVARCKPRPKDLRELSAEERHFIEAAMVDDEIAVDLTTVDEFSMYRYLRSERLDLEHLSPGRLLFSPPLHGVQSGSARIGNTDAGGHHVSRTGLAFYKLREWTRSLGRMK